MWHNPNYPRPPKPQPPIDRGHNLATFRRGGIHEPELRISLADIGGHPYVSLRVWEQDSDGQSWPVRGKGCSIRLREVDGAIAALSEVKDLIARQRAGKQGGQTQPADGE